MRVLTEMPAGVVGVEAGAKFSAEVPAPALAAATKDGGKIRIVLVTVHAWMRDGLRMFAWAVPGEVRAFPAGEQEEAIAWAAATPEKP